VPAFQFLLALALASPETNVEALRRQGATAIQLHRMQLDADPALEAVIQYELPEKGVHAVVLDQRGSEWREAGRYNSWWNFTKSDASRFLEFRQTVGPGVNDILVRTRSGGTEDARTTLEIARLKDGAMITVLSIKEHETAMEHPSGDVFTTEARIEYAPGAITVRSTKKPGSTNTCQLYRWNAAAYRFEDESCP
jgi:hypothetical protein